MKNKAKVPAGLKKCEKCGYYKGKAESKGVMYDVSCICHNQTCHRCGEKVCKYKVPSTIYEEGIGIRHVSIVCAWGHKCPDGVNGQLENSCLIDPNTGQDLLHPGKQSHIGKMLSEAFQKEKEARGEI